MTTIINKLNEEGGEEDSPSTIAKYSGDLFTLPDTVPNWSIWSPNYRSLPVQRTKKEESIAISSIKKVSDLERQAGSKRTAVEADMMVETGKGSTAGGRSAVVVKRRRSERVLVQLNGGMEVGGGCRRSCGASAI